jgi:transcription initiation factor TFIIH subunit 4
LGLTIFSEREQALAMMKILHMTKHSKDGAQVVALEEHFSSSLRLALTGGGNHQSFGVPSSDQGSGHVNTKFLDEYAISQWEGILHYVVNSAGAAKQQEGQGPATAVKQLLEAGNLVSRGRHGGGITQAGFTFLLQETNAQVWSMLLIWVGLAEQVCFSSPKTSVG